MPVTIATDIPRVERISKNLGILTGTITFDTSYPAGGESISGAAAVGIADYFGPAGLISLECRVQGGGAGYNFVFDNTLNSEKIKVFGNAPAIVFEEKHLAVTKNVTLDYPAAWIINVATAGQNEAWTARGDTLADNEFQLSSAFADGTRTAIGTYGSTDTIFVTYATQAWQDLYVLLVDEEALTAGTGNKNLVSSMMAFGHCYSSTGTKVLLPVDFDDSTATAEIGIDMTVASGAGTNCVDFNSAENNDEVVVTYLKKPATTTWIGSRHVDDEDPSNAGADPFTNAFNYPLLMWCITGALTVTGGVTQTIIESGALCAAGEVNMLSPADGSKSLLAVVGAASAAEHVWGGKSNVTVTAGCYMKGYPWEIPNLAQLEVKDGSDLGNVVVRFTAIGYKAD